MNFWNCARLTLTLRRGNLTHRMQPARVCTKRQVRERAAALIAARATKEEEEEAAATAAAAAKSQPEDADHHLTDASAEREAERRDGASGEASTSRQQQHEGQLAEKSRRVGGREGVSRQPPWQVVNRRRVRGKGWHIDIGPGFDTDWRRRLAGHPYQGAVVLVLLSDWAPG